MGRDPSAPATAAIKLGLLSPSMSTPLRWSMTINTVLIRFGFQTCEMGCCLSRAVELRPQHSVTVAPKNGLTTKVYVIDDYNVDL